ncbi:DUF4124 domain-containing protein [Chitinimonas koreensis]|nr:DUF4124 domain-containing protein [Chitinimonas koreensis]QNM94921.1 DUF4124 domain-containing protein [Chitinimonas koreensis]
MLKPTIAALAVAAIAMPATAINKCVDSAGKITFSDTPCPTSDKSTNIKIRPSTGNAAPANAQPASTDRPLTAGERLVEEARQLDRSKKRSEVEASIAKLDRDYENLAASMQADLDALKAKKSRAKNNLAGATWEQSISTEMQAITTSYDNRMKTNREQANRLREQLK